MLKQKPKSSANAFPNHYSKLIKIISNLARITKEPHYGEKYFVCEQTVESLHTTLNLFNKIYTFSEPAQIIHFLDAAADVFCSWKIFFMTGNPSVCNKIMMMMFNEIETTCDNIKANILHAYTERNLIEGYHHEHKWTVLKTHFNIRAIQEDICAAIEYDIVPDGITDKIYKEKLQKYKIELAMEDFSQSILESIPDLHSPILFLMQEPTFEKLNTHLHKYTQNVHLIMYIFNISLARNIEQLNTFQTTLFLTIVSHLKNAIDLVLALYKHNFIPTGYHEKYDNLAFLFKEYFESLEVHLQFMEAILTEESVIELKISLREIELSYAEITYLNGDYGVTSKNLTQLLSCLPDNILTQRIHQFKTLVHTPFTVLQKLSATLLPGQAFLGSILYYFGSHAQYFPFQNNDSDSNIQNTLSVLLESIISHKLETEQQLQDKFIDTLAVLVNVAKICQSQTAILFYKYYYAKIMFAWATIFDVEHPSLQQKLLYESFIEEFNLATEESGQKPEVDLTEEALVSIPLCTFEPFTLQIINSIEELAHGEVEKMELSCEKFDTAFSEMVEQFKDLNLHQTLPQPTLTTLPMSSEKKICAQKLAAKEAAELNIAKRKIIKQNKKLAALARAEEEEKNKYYIEVPKTIHNVIVNIKKHDIKTSIIGGYVRDLLINFLHNKQIKPNDIDIYVQCMPEVLIKILPDYALKKPKKIELHTGIIIYLFKTKIDDINIDFICTDAKLESYFKSFDFTFNTVACDENGKVIVSAQVLQDFKSKTWNTNMQPMASAFEKTPIIIIRAALINKHIGFELPKAMILLMQQYVPLIATVEFDVYLCHITKTFLRGSAITNINILKELQLFYTLIPFLQQKLTNTIEKNTYDDYCIKLFEPIDKLSKSERIELYHPLLILAHLLKSWESEAATFFNAHTRINSKYIVDMQKIYAALKPPPTAIMHNNYDHYDINQYQASRTILFNPHFQRSLEEMNSNPYSKLLVQSNHLLQKFKIKK